MRALCLAALLSCALGSLAPALAAPSGPPAPSAPYDTAAWRAGLATLVRELPARHPAPFLQLTHARWDSAGEDLARRLPTLTRDQAVVGFLQLVALVGDAHTALAPDSTLGLRFYPLELYAFDDGLFVRRADPAHADLVGARVVRIGNASAEDAMARVSTLIPHENEWWARAWAPFELMIPEYLDGLGLAPDVEHLALVVERGGRTETVRVSPLGRIADQHGHGADPIARDGWAAMRQAPAPWWEQRGDDVFWWTFDRPTGTLYVSMRAVAPAPQSSTNRAQWDALFALADSVQPARLVLDLRENTGGNGALNRYPVQQILRRPALDRPDRLYVIVGRRTFSAGQQFANLLEAWTQATFVGEPSGQRPSQYGDHRPLALPGTGLTVLISSVFHQAPNEFDARPFVPPVVYTPLDSRSYARGVDPAMAAILAPDTTAAVADLVARAVAAGDSAAAERALAAAQAKTANRFRRFESEVNALGYRLLAEGKLEQAVHVFGLNARAYPLSPNAYDSLGEALVRSGRREAAIAAYRRALELAPGFPSAVQALARLGAAG